MFVKLFLSKAAQPDHIKYVMNLIPTVTHEKYVPDPSTGYFAYFFGNNLTIK